MFYLEILDEFYDEIHQSYGDYEQILNAPTKNIEYVYHTVIQNFKTRATKTHAKDNYLIPWDKDPVVL